MARILVVDDEPEIGEILEMLLTHVGHEVRVEIGRASCRERV